MSDDNPQTPPPGTQQFNIGTDGNMGLVGVWKLVGNASAMVVIAVAFLYAGHYILSVNREDRLYDRQMFRESLQSIQSEDNRRTGEIKGSMDAMNGATRELTNEIKSWRQSVHESKSSSSKGGPP